MQSTATVMTEIILSQVKAVELEFLRRVHTVTHSCENCRALNVEPLLIHFLRYQLRWFVHVFKMLHE